MSGYHALLLAAGAGSRFGGAKLLAPWRGEALVRAAARTALSAPVDHVVAVTGSDADRVEAVLSDLVGSRLRLARAPDWQGGLSASLRAGVAALPPGSRGVVVFLGDMPLVPPGHAGMLLAALDAGAPGAEMVLAGVPAHPAAFGRSLYAGLMALTGDRGGRGLLRGRPGVARIETVDPGSTFDVDRPEDMEGASATSEPLGPDRVRTLRARPCRA